MERKTIEKIEKLLKEKEEITNKKRNNEKSIRNVLKKNRNNILIFLETMIDNGKLDYVLNKKLKDNRFFTDYIDYSKLKEDSVYLLDNNILQVDYHYSDWDSGVKHIFVFNLPIEIFNEKASEDDIRNIAEDYLRRKTLAEIKEKEDEIKKLKEKLKKKKS